ncbi:gamma-tubulin complex component 5-like [Selaginella moellendorffii]|uniref:gamma-tubulin complex component 5-like n=1 Tax=Selaginella moellendorffii TaxID=88036 RepID=UPI000D1CADF0|nr:gamma-tubulin complex component 5-like [Selaginella moellendorffii]XP_024519216.1 gamma-tubulin complex component 5-like [Selaginella moellendorffii]XP_024519217.1 gamma-tubulin complex component 5-like [Selaginella moellendorffii]|eukprot:XP_024519215.1 gamma-tubulin complex component 5-like [Selaginella moellendorffii]
MGVPVPLALENGSIGCHGELIDLLSSVRTVELPFAVPKQLFRVTEAQIVKDVLHALQGSPGETILWDKAKLQFYFKLGTHVSHLSPSSLLVMLRPFLSAATSSRRVQKFVSKASMSLSHKFPTLEAFAKAVSLRLEHIRRAVLEKETEAVQEPSSVTLLNLSESLSWVSSAFKFLDHVVNNAVPNNFFTYDAANLSTHILTFLFDALNKFSLLKDGEEEAYRTLLLLFVVSLWPHVQLLDTWLQEGSLSDPFGELFFYANASASIQDTAFWQTGYLVRYTDQTGEERQSLSCASFLQPIAMPILSAGKSLQLLRHFQKEGVAKASTVQLIQAPETSLFENFCLSLKKLLVQDNLPPTELSSLTKIAAGTEGHISSTIILPSLDDHGLRNAVFSNDKGHVDRTSYLHGSGCGSILHRQMLVDEKELKLVFATLAEISSEEESTECGAAISMLEWLQRVDFPVTPSSTVIVQECLISLITKQVNAIGAQLLEKLMGEWRLMEELSLLRSLYLMGSGDLLQQFSFVLFNKLDRGEPWDDFYELNTMLQESVRSSADAAMYSTLDSLVVKMESRGTAERSPVHRVQFTGRSPVFGIDTLQDLRFEYKVAWPLELIIDSDAIKRYNQVMCFLLKVKRAKQALDKACRWTWKGDSDSHKPQLLLQMKLMHFVNTLHHYVMDQVLYSSWLELCEGMSSARSLDEVISCHDMYLISIQRQCFVAPDKLWTLISSRVKSILGLALEFYAVQRGVVGSAGTAPRSQLEIDNVAKQFDECIAFLLRVLSFKLNVGHFPHLTELITRINYNNYYLSESGQLLTPIPDLQPHRLKKNLFSK